MYPSIDLLIFRNEGLPSKQKENTHIVELFIYAAHFRFLPCYGLIRFKYILKFD